jgi:hypothetical protein
MFSQTWNMEIDEWAKFAICINTNPVDPISWFETREEAEAELQEFDEEDRLGLVIVEINR